MELTLKELQNRPLLREFAERLSDLGYDDESIDALLCKPWDEAYPPSLMVDDVRDYLNDFLFQMAELAVEKVFGESYWHHKPYRIRIVTEPNIDVSSHIYIIELKTKTVLAEATENTWEFTPDTVEESLKDLLKQLEESKPLLAARIVVEW